MIVYFSATGNCEFIAKKIANATNDKAVSITEIKTEIHLEKSEQLGIVIPTYFWGLPSIVEGFFKNTKIVNAANSYIFCVATYGTTTGQIDAFLNKILKKQKLKLSASFSIKTVDNWTVLFDVSNKQQNEAVLKLETEQLEQVIEKVSQKSQEFIEKDKKPMWLCKGARKFYDKARKTSHLQVEETCIACGLCAKDCPVGAIEMENGKPKWVKEKCTMCFRCLHRCPKFAIQYDNKTQNHGQYVHPDK